MVLLDELHCIKNEKTVKLPLYTIESGIICFCGNDILLLFFTIDLTRPVN